MKFKFTFLLVYFPSILGNKKLFPTNIEIFILVLIYLKIFLESISSINPFDFWTRIFLYLIVSFVIGIVGFSLVYLLNRNKNIFNLSPFFMSVFSFCFSLSVGALWQTFRHLMNYFWEINIQSFNVSDALSFMAVHILGATIISIAGYVYIKSSSEKSYFKKLFKRVVNETQIAKSQEKKIQRLIRQGESEKLEFKETLRYNIHTKEFDRRISHSILKTVCAFLNTKGGTLLVGVSDKGSVEGLERDDFKTDDKFMLYFNNLFRKQLGNEFIPFVSYEIVKVGKKSVFVVSCRESKKEVFLKNDSDNEEFYIRTGPASVALTGSKLVGYVNRKFRKRK